MLIGNLLTSQTNNQPRPNLARRRPYRIQLRLSPLNEHRPFSALMTDLDRAKNNVPIITAV